MSTRFTNRAEAGAALAQVLLRLDLPGPVVVLALPRGGVPVAAVIAKALHAPLDLVLVRKIGVPSQPELAVAAVAEGDPPVIVVDEQVRRWAGVDMDYIESAARRESLENARRREVYLSGHAAPERAGRTLILVDDGVATGSTMRAALRAVRTQRPRAVVLAVPVAAAQTLQRLRAEVDHVVCLVQPVAFEAVGDYYDDFHQLDDAQVIAALQAARQTGTAEGSDVRPD